MHTVNASMPLLMYVSSDLIYVYIHICYIYNTDELAPELALELAGCYDTLKLALRSRLGTTVWYCTSAKPEVHGTVPTKTTKARIVRSTQ